MGREFKWYIVVCTILCGIRSISTQQVYNIEDICNSAGVYDVDSDRIVYLRGGYSNTQFLGQTCSVKLRAKNGDQILSFEEPQNNLICGANLDIIFASTKKSYTCNTLASGKFSTLTRDAEIRLSMTAPNAKFGSFQLIVSAGIKPQDPALSSSTSASVGLIVGAVVGVCAFLFLICIIGICMHKKIQRAKANEALFANQTKEQLEADDFSPNRSVGFTNQLSANGEPSPMAKTRLLNGHEENGQYSPNSNRRANRPDTLNIKNINSKPVPSARDGLVQSRPGNKDYQDDGDDTYYNLDEDKIETPNRPKTPVTPILSALQSNAKFRKSFSENERDAEDRAQRISYSSNDSINQRPALPKVPIASGLPRLPSPTRTAKVNKSMSMRKATRPHSFGDLSNSSATPPSEGTDEDRERKQDTNVKPKHTLRPNHKQSPEQDRKQNNKKLNLTNKAKDQRLNDLQNDDENERIGMFTKQSSVRGSKGGRKSPRLGKNSKGFSHRRTGSRGDDAISIGSKTDLESLPPLQRSSSRTSLYASRSSLYSRRRGSTSGRDRTGSCADSMASYAHDDIDYYRRSHRSYNDYDDEDFGGYEKPISRNDRLRMSKSDHDLGRAMKEIATQTLRETATQTGLEQSVVVHPKRIVKKRPRSKSMTAMGTQTSKKEKTRTKSKEDLASTDDEVDQTESRKPEIKPKPKPKPRKSLTNADSAVQSDNEGLKRRRSKKGTKGNAHKAKSMEDVTHETNADKAVPGPQVPQPVHHSQTVPSNLRTFGPPGSIPVPPAYSTLNPGSQPAQFITSQGQPVLIQGHGQPVLVQGHPAMNAQQPIIFQQPNNPALVRQVAPGQFPVAHAPGQPRKSNWETLLEMTEKQKAGIPTDTESVVSSVFTSNPPPPTYMTGQPGFYPYQQGYQQQPVQQHLVQQPPVQQVPFQSIPQQLVPSQMAAQYPPSHGWVPTPPSNNESDHSSSGTSGSGSSTSGMYTTQSQGKSSWDRLKEMTDLQYKITYTSEKTDHNDSVV